MLPSPVLTFTSYIAPMNGESHVSNHVIYYSSRQVASVIRMGKVEGKLISTRKRTDVGLFFPGGNDTLIESLPESQKLISELRDCVLPLSMGCHQSRGEFRYSAFPLVTRPLFHLMNLLYL